MGTQQAREAAFAFPALRKVETQAPSLTEVSVAAPGRMEGVLLVVVGFETGKLEISLPNSRL